MCEIEPFPQQVLKRHWPEVTVYDDVRTLDPGQLEPVGLLAGGFPCQDISVAGRRAGLAGERSGLFHEFMRLAAGLRPKWLLLENVPGLLSSNRGRDMGAVLGKLGELGYGYAYRMLDAQYFGVAQRRRRVFIVGCLGDWAGAASVLFEPESCEGSPAPSREEREVSAALLASGAGASRPAGIASEADFLVAGTLGGGSGQRGWCDDLDRAGAFVPVAATLTTREGRRNDATAETLLPMVAATLTGGSATGKGISRPGRRREDDINLVPAMGFHWQAGEQATVAATEEGCPTVMARQIPAVMAVGVDPYNGSVSPASPTLGSNCGQSTGRNGIMQGMAVRRLTPLECERLQGFPDNWTKLDDKTPDAPRYRACGNAVCVPAAAWIGRRIMEAKRRGG
jgi:DNA (cytosine-5)-methyltransferase 1